MIARGLTFLLLTFLTGTAFAGPTWTIPVGWMGDLTFDGTFLYMPTMVGSRPTIVLDPKNGAIVGTIEQNPFFSAAPRGAAFDGAGHLFLTTMSSDVCAMDRSGVLVGCFAVSIPDDPDSFRSGALASDGTYLYIGHIDTNFVVVTDTAGTFVRYFNSGRRPEGMVYDPETGHLWLLDLFVPDRVTEITTDGIFVRDCYVPFALSNGLGGFAIVGSKFYIAVPQNPANPEDGTLIHIVQRNSLACNPPVHRPLK